MASAQLALSLPPAATRRRKVSKRQFSAIVFLRKQQRRVYRAGGHDFFVDGRICDTHEMTRIAKALGWQP